ncbi:MAG: hypothetical protein LBB85_10775, partial [Dysgonamonadaceae bacterium]|nr:hypothetical protein [Dysgonamonadaceae bacterium]
TSYSTDTGYRGAHRQKMESTTAVNGTTNGTSKSSTENGFDVLLVGEVDSGSAHVYGTHAYLWSSSSYDSSYAWYRSLRSHSSYAGVGRYTTGGKYFMYSVRCKKN